MCDTIEVLKDDIIIISSDGLYDNLDLAEIEQIFHKVSNCKGFIFL
jgi:serine/threonine protein phosphatase PrpC